MENLGLGRNLDDGRGNDKVSEVLVGLWILCVLLGFEEEKNIG